ncbi:hypothetical protein KUTeg_024871 [Tegillarca granosa]|uniref:Guanylate cyclase domain-containing protein n=1 Tax=Tegillarca granosa TaxID=220873 RepID=A0ABQ9DZK8_TEGGR|nr:hypothetical protein KUTeg_024871 [Tegillarca granosa]
MGHYHHYFSSLGGILALIRQAQGLNPNPEEESALKKLTSHVPGIVTFADHNKALPWSSRYSTSPYYAFLNLGSSELVAPNVQSTPKDYFNGTTNLNKCMVFKYNIYFAADGFTALCERYSAMQNKGIDQLTKTLNDYLGAIVEGIVNSEGDVLKFAGDAILAVWRVNTANEMSAAVAKVVRCCLDIQSKCGEWKTDIGVTLTVKMGVSSGEMNVTFLGNNEFRVYVELGKAVSDVNAAEHFCQSGYVVLSPEAWNLLQQEKIGWNFETMDDGKHIRVCF